MLTVMIQCTKVLPNQINVYPPTHKPKTDSNKNNDDGDITGPYADGLGSLSSNGMMGYLQVSLLDRVMLGDEDMTYTLHHIIIIH